jgi:sugar phosphate isomerase/epimerase
MVLGSWPPEVHTVEETKDAVKKLAELGVDGIKIIPRPHVNIDIIKAMAESIREHGLKAGIAVHVPQSSELDAWDLAIAGGELISIEHTYGIPQAAISGTQNFPPDYNYSNELDRFRWSGYV